MESNVSRALEILTVFDVWDEAPFAEAIPTRDGVYLNPFKQSVNRTGSLSISQGGKRWKDFHSREPAGGVWQFVKRCHPTWEKIDVSRYLVEKAGLEWNEGKAYAPKTPEQMREARLEAKRKCEAAKREIYKKRRQALEFPARGKCGPAMSEEVAERWAAGIEHLREYPEKCGALAKKRGWPVEWVWALVELELISMPELPWSSPGKVKRAWAWLVECPDWRASSMELVPVGYHTKYFSKKAGGTVWNFVPNYKPSSWGSSEFQRAMWGWCQQQGFEQGREVVKPLPVILGNVMEAELLIPIEGQWDAATVWGALGGFDDVFDLPIAVAGLRGAHSVETFLAYYGDWLKARKPHLWIIPDNDDAGDRWVKRDAVGSSTALNVTFLDQVVHAGLPVVKWTQIKKEHGGDFNAFYQKYPLTPTQMIEWLRTLKLLP